MIISERIFKILNEKNMTQNEFAKRVGIAGSTISDWKTKRTNPSADKIMIICEVLSVTPEQLLSGKEPENKRLEADEGKKIELSKFDMKMIEDIHGLKEPQKRRLVRYIKALKEIEILEEYDGEKDRNNDSRQYEE